MAWGKAGSDTLTSAGDAYELTVTPSKFFQILDHTIPSGTTGQQINFNNDTTVSYALRYSGNGAADGTGASRSGINHEWDQTRLDRFVMDYWSDISGEETLGISFSVYNDATGAGNVPSRFEEVWKWDDTAQVSEIDMINPASGSFDTDSNLSALGSDLTPSAAIPFPSDVQVGSRAEITDTRKIYHYNSTGDVITDGSYTVLKFTEDGTFTPTSAFDVEYLVVAGGGSGGGENAGGGGGGAGGYRTGTGHGVTAQAYSITVGAGGAGQPTYNTQGNNGSNSIFDTITSTGGGGGGTWNGVVGKNGGSGGGGGAHSAAGGTASPSGQGNNGGGGGGGLSFTTGGGGGAGAVGGAGGSVSGNGGDGLSSSITGSAVTYSAGGGGGSNGQTAGTGGSGSIGGDGSDVNGVDANAGDINTGSGGGGASDAGSVSGAGGSGIVIIRFLTSGNTYTTSLSSNVWTEEGT